MEAGDAVAERCDGPDFVDLDLRVVVRDLIAKELRNLVCLDLSHFCPFQWSVNIGQLRLLTTNCCRPRCYPPTADALIPTITSGY